MCSVLTFLLDKLNNFCVEFGWGFFARHAGYVQNLEANLAQMKKAVEDLMALKERLTQKVHVQEQLPQMKRLPEVNLWFERVDIALAEGHELIKGADQEVQRLCCAGYGSKNCWSSSIFGKMVDECHNGLLALKTTGDQFGVVVEEALAELVAELPCNTTVGLETKLAEVWTCLEDKNVGIVGLYGIGGVGKTTLLSQIRNKFIDTCKDYLVIWIVVSKDCNPEKIQADIRKETGFSHEQWSTNDILTNYEKRSSFCYWMAFGSNLTSQRWEFLLQKIYMGERSYSQHVCSKCVVKCVLKGRSELRLWNGSTRGNCFKCMFETIPSTPTPTVATRIFTRASLLLSFIFLSYDYLTSQ